VVKALLLVALSLTALGCDRGVDNVTFNRAVRAAYNEGFIAAGRQIAPPGQIHCKPYRHDGGPSCATGTNNSQCFYLCTMFIEEED
jgi:hypothetical protein